MRTLSIVAAVLIAAGCSSPKDAIVPTQADKLETLKPVIEKLAAEEKELLAGYIMRHTMSVAANGLFGVKADPIPDGMKVGQAIEEQRDFLAKQKAKEAEEKALKAKLLAEREKAMEAMRDAVTVTVVSKGIKVQHGYSGMVMDENLEVTFGYKNNTDKPIAGVKGTVDVLDMFGDELSGFHISNDKGIQPGGSVTWTGSRSVRYSVGNNKDRKFAELDDSKYKVVWKPDVIVFADGTKLAVPKD